jgi:cell division protease FtsH
LIYREISNGATSDLDKCSQIARNMVKQYGMSRLGRVCFQEQEGSGFLPAGTFGESRAYSEETAREIDLEVRRILDECTEEVRQILGARRAALESVAQLLVEKEVIEGDELRELLIKHYPGPKLVPGTLARAPEKLAGFVAEEGTTPLPERRVEGSANGS